MWTVVFRKKAQKQIAQLNENLVATLLTLVDEIKELGPIRGNWPNFSSLGKNLYHCHIKKGKPTYVVCWEVIDKKIKIIEVKYVGTHEKAPY